MWQVTTELDAETIDWVFDKRMLEIYRDLNQTYKARKRGEGFAMFDVDQAKDLAEIKKLRRAMRLVIKYACDPEVVEL